MTELGCNLELDSRIYLPSPPERALFFSRELEPLRTLSIDGSRELGPFRTLRRVFVNHAHCLVYTFVCFICIRRLFVYVFVDVFVVAVFIYVLVNVLVDVRVEFVVAYTLLDVLVDVLEDVLAGVLVDLLVDVFVNRFFVFARGCTCRFTCIRGCGCEPCWLCRHGH